MTDPFVRKICKEAKKQTPDGWVRVKEGATQPNDRLFVPGDCVSEDDAGNATCDPSNGQFVAIQDGEHGDEAKGLIYVIREDTW